MAVKLRLQRIGKRNRPSYRLCVIDSRKPRGGEYLENIGFYDPYIKDDQKRLHFNRERVEYWLSVGAQPSETVESFFRKAQVGGLVRPKKRTHKRPKRAAKPAKKTKSKATTKTKAKSTAKTKPKSKSRGKTEKTE